MSLWREVTLDDRADGLLASPYFDWARSTDFTYYGGATWLPVLIELRDGKDNTAQAFAQLVQTLQASPEPAWAAQLRVPDVYIALPARVTRPTHFIALLATRKFLDDVYAGKNPGERIRGFELGRATAPSSGTAMPVASVASFQSTPRVVVAVIDDGIAFAHERFLSRDGTTRIEYLWNQDQPSTAWGGWNYGHEVTKRDPNAGIDKLMGDSRHGSLVDEDEVYRRSGDLDHAQPGHKSLAARAAHGTHVLDLACRSMQRPPADERPIVAVQLPVATVEDTSSATLAPQIYNGLLYTIARAGQIASDAGSGQLPLVVNVSYGMTAGPHDGSSALERALDELISGCNPVNAQGHPTRPGFRVVLPAGNNFLSRCHAQFALPASKSRQLAWRVLPDDWTESSLQIWLPGGAGDIVSVTIEAPDTSTTVAFNGGTAQALFNNQGLVFARAQYYLPEDTGAHSMLQLFIGPTADPTGTKSVAPPGLWRITVHNTGSIDLASIHAWIQRGDTAPGYPQRGRQSYFDDPDDVRYDAGGRALETDAPASYVRRAASLNAIATGRQTLVVGGFRASDGATAAYSSGGPVVHPPGRGLPSDDGPDALFPSEDAPAHPGVLAAGTRSGSCVAMHGTSVSAPQATRWLANAMASGQANDRTALFDAAQLKNVNPPVPPQRGGGGRLTVPPNRPRR